MQIKLGSRKRATVIIACIIVILVVIVGGIVIRILIRFCKDHLGTPPPDDLPDDAQIADPLDYSVPAIRVEFLPGATTTTTNPAAWTPCDGFGGALVLPSALPEGTRVWVQRSTNLIDWADLSEVFPDASGTVVGWCDTTPPWPQAFYRLRAAVQ